MSSKLIIVVCSEKYSRVGGAVLGADGSVCLDYLAPRSPLVSTGSPEPDVTKLTLLDWISFWLLLYSYIFHSVFIGKLISQCYNLAYSCTLKCENCPGAFLCHLLLHTEYCSAYWIWHFLLNTAANTDTVAITAVYHPHSNTSTGISLCSSICRPSCA